jgi:hypothetical protein
MHRTIDRLTRLFGFHFGPNAAAEWVTGSLLTRGNATPGAIGATTTVNTDVDCAGDSKLTVLVEMTGAANGDLAVTVVPFESDNLTPQNNTALAAQRSTGPTFAGGVVQYEGEFDVSGFSKVRIQIRNTTAGALNINRASWRLS